MNFDEFRRDCTFSRAPQVWLLFELICSAGTRDLPFLYGSSEILEECQDQQGAGPFSGEEQEHYYQSQSTTRNSVIVKNG
jgi:hypothetical protein